MSLELTLREPTCIALDDGTFHLCWPSAQTTICNRDKRHKSKVSRVRPETLCRECLMEIGIVALRASWPKFAAS